jgi:hypothetical protein
MPALRHLQLTSVLRTLCGQPVPAARATSAPTAGRSPASTPTLPAAPRASATAVPDADLVARALTAGASRAAAERLAGAVAALPARERAQVAHPLRPARGSDVLRLGTAAARQTDGTTCGSAVLAMLAAAGDPTLAYWLVTGDRVAGHEPVELRGVDDVAGPAGRFGALQEALKRRSNARSLFGLLPWPPALGTPPWGAARVARYPGVAYRSVLVDDTRPGETTRVLARAGRALDRGVPVPLYTGGDLSGGLASAVPRHVVLLTGRTAEGYAVYEPSSGRLHDVASADLVVPHGPLAALGHWSHVAWAVLPVRA